MRTRPGFALAIGALALAACSYNWVSVVPASPAVIPHRVVVVALLRSIFVYDVDAKRVIACE